MIKLPDKLLKFSDIANKIENDLDFDFSADLIEINSVEEFEDKLLKPFYNNKKIYYRGESTVSHSRPLIPTIFRDRNNVVEYGHVRIIDSSKIVEFYNKNREYTNFYKNTFGDFNEDNLYSFLAFSQHYYGISPLLDLTKDPFVAMSFALKNRKEYIEDILIYTVEIKNEKDYTDNIDVANKWLKDYSVIVLNDTNKPSFDALKNELEKYKDYHNEVKGRSVIDLTSPSAKLIDVPINDLVKFQHGVFLLLDDFVLVGNGYLTKKIRDKFVVKKYIINKNICPQLLKIQLENQPYYNYNDIVDLSKVISKMKG